MSQTQNVLGGRHVMWGLFALLTVGVVLSGCSDSGGGGDVAVPEPCDGLCPPEQCVFGVCEDDTPNNANNANNANNTPMGCPDDAACADSEYCDLSGGGDLGQCVEGCREGGCAENERCDTETRQCVVEEVTCEGDDDCEEGEICLEQDEAGVFDCVEGCRGDADCPEELGCVENVCAGELCGEDQACPEGQYCDEGLGRCLLGCGEDADCDEGRYCSEETGACEVGCRVDDDCDPGESCLLVGTPDGQRQRCAATPCSEDGDCAEDFYCDLGSCEFGCRDGQCPGALRCDLETRECVAPPCEDNDDCQDGEYCDLEGEPSICRFGCNEDDQCARRQSCDLTLNTCTCEDDGDCDDGLFCLFERCSDLCRGDDDCPGTLTCDLEQGACEDTCVDDDLEPNNVVSEASVLEPGSYELSMCNTGVEGVEYDDCYAIDLFLDEVLRVSVTFDHDDGDLDLRLYDPQQIAVDISQSEGDLEALTYRANVNGKHVFCVEPVGDGFEQQYSLELVVDEAVLPCLEDFNEVLGDNTCPEAEAIAEPLSLNEETLFEGRSICEGDSDYIAVRMRAGQELNAVLTRTDGVATLDAEVVDLDCDTVLAQTDNLGPIRDLFFSADADGTYFVHVFAEEPVETADYELTLLLGAGDFVCREDTLDNVLLEPNDVANQATILSVERGVSTRVEDLYICQEDADVYSVFVTNALDTIRATLRQNINDQPLAVEVLDIDGETVLASERGPNDEKQALSPPLNQSGNYFVRVRQFDNDVPAEGINYDLSVLVESDEICLDDVNEPNNTLRLATQIGDESIDAQICREEPGELDTYAIDLLPGDRVFVSIEYNHELIAPLNSLPGILYGPGGLEDFRDFTVRDGFSDVDTLSIPEFFVTTEDAGTWYFQLGVGDLGQAVEYTLTVSIESPNCDEQGPLEAFEPNELCATAFAVTPGESLDGFVCGPTGDVDFFAVDVADGQTLSVDMDYFHFDGNLDIDVFNPSNTLVGGSYQNGPNFEAVTIEDADPGTYCIRVFAVGGLTQNDYSIEVGLQ